MQDCAKAIELTTYCTTVCGSKRIRVRFCYALNYNTVVGSRHHGAHSSMGASPRGFERAPGTIDGALTRFVSLLLLPSSCPRCLLHTSSLRYGTTWRLWVHCWTSELDGNVRRDEKCPLAAIFQHTSAWSMLVQSTPKEETSPTPRDVSCHGPPRHCEQEVLDLDLASTRSSTNHEFDFFPFRSSIR